MYHLLGVTAYNTERETPEYSCVILTRDTSNYPSLNATSTSDDYSTHASIQSSSIKQSADYNLFIFDQDINWYCLMDY